MVSDVKNSSASLNDFSDFEMTRNVSARPKSVKFRNSQNIFQKNFRQIGEKQLLAKYFTTISKVKPSKC